jgi:large subunit ribosomal protein L9
MKVILLRDVAKIGRKNSIVDIPDGYALNQLIPKKWAEAATPANIKKITQNKAAAETTYQNEASRFDGVVKSLQETVLQVPAGQVNEQGHLFKAIHEEDIVLAAKSKGLTLVRSEIKIEQPIKSLGAHTITLKQGSKQVVCSIEIIKP